MESFVVKCRCRGTNADCHLCFGTGDVLSGTEFAFESYAVLSPRKHPPAADPTRRAPERQKKTDLETLFLRHAGMQNAASAREVMLAAGLVRKRGESGTDQVLRASLRAPRHHFSEFVRLLAAALRSSSQKPALALVDVNGALRDAGLSVRLSPEQLQQMRNEWGIGRSIAPTPRNTAPKDAERQDSQVRGRVLQPVGRGSADRPADGRSPFAVLAAMNDRPSGIKHVLVVSGGEPLRDRVEQLKRFLSRHGIARVYVAGSKRTVRSVSDLAAVEAVHVDNPANAAFIRSGSGVAVFDLDNSND